MTELYTWLAQYEQQEKDCDMHFSVYYIPSVYQDITQEGDNE